MKKLEIKDIALIVLFLLLSVSVIVCSVKKTPDTNKNTIKDLHNDDKRLNLNNDSLFKVNELLNKNISDLELKIQVKTLEIDTKETEIKRLKNRKNETPNYVKRLGANDVANAMSNYIERTENKDGN